MFREFEKREALQRYLNGEKVSVMYDETLTAESPTYTVEPLDDMLGRFRFLVELPEQKEVKTQAVQSEKQDNNKYEVVKLYPHCILLKDTFDGTRICPGYEKLMLMMRGME